MGRSRRSAKLSKLLSPLHRERLQHLRQRYLWPLSPFQDLLDRVGRKQRQSQNARHVTRRNPLSLNQVGYGGELARLKHPLPTEGSRQCLDLLAFGPQHERPKAAFAASWQMLSTGSRIKMNIPSEPRSLAVPFACEQRRALVQQPHVAPLNDLAGALRAQGRGAVPDFDPIDGGVRAKALFLFEKPGPMTDALSGLRRRGSGFISRDNDDPTAEATFRFMAQARIPRQLTVIWNIVPWWNGTRRITAAELRDGVAAVDALVALLPELRVIMLVGRKAGRARPLLEGRNVRIFQSAHPSPIVRASRPVIWNSIPHQWAEIIPLIV